MNRKDFMELLKTNKGLIFLKFGAEWCAPCKIIDPYIEKIFNKERNVEKNIVLKKSNKQNQHCCF